MPIFDSENYVVVPKTSVELLTEELLHYIPVSWQSYEARHKGGMLYAIMSMLALAVSFCKDLIARAKLELRIATATSLNLDLIAQDFFGSVTPLKLPRNLNETDANYRKRIVAEVLRPRGTVPAIVQALTTLTGAAPVIFEPFNLQVVAAWTDNFNGAFSQGYPSFSYGSSTINQFNGPQSGSSPNVGVGAMGDLQSPYVFFVSVNNNPNNASTADIIALVDRIKPVGTIAYVSVR